MMIMMMMMMLIDYEKRKKIINKRFVNNLLAMRLRVVLRDGFFFWSSKNVFRSFFPMFYLISLFFCLGYLRGNITATLIVSSFVHEGGSYSALFWPPSFTPPSMLPS